MSQTGKIIPHRGYGRMRHQTAFPHSNRLPRATGLRARPAAGLRHKSNTGDKAVVELQQLCLRALEATISKGGGELPHSLDNPGRSARCRGHYFCWIVVEGTVA